MSLLKLTFAGQIKKVEFRQAGDTPLAEVSLCRKNYAKPGEEATFTWIKVAIFKPADWMTAKLVKGAMIAGCGEFTMRSYTAKDGSKGVSADVRCQGFDVEVAGDESGEPSAKAPAKAAPVKSAPAVATDDDSEPPF